jgi:signal transduction histidine kinase
LRDQIESVESTHDDATFRVDGSLPDNCVNDLSDSVFYNLLRNAVEHNDKAVPEVTISVATTEHTVVVKTADNGPGIYQDDIFLRGERTRQRGVGDGAVSGRHGRRPVRR